MAEEEKLNQEAKEKAEIIEIISEYEERRPHKKQPVVQ